MGNIGRLEPQLLAQTEEWWVVNKPAQWLSVPGRSQSPVLIDWLRRHHGAAWVVHRLDEQTSGVMLFARTEDSHRQACEWFSKHQVRKVYEFLASGSPRLPVFKLDSPIEGQKSATQVEVVTRFSAGDSAAAGFLGRARPVTGRRHQIRIHLSQAGFPLWGDARYQGLSLPRKDLSVERVALHARSLQLPSGESFEATWPADFSDWVRKAGEL